MLFGTNLTPASPLFSWSYHNRKLLGRDSWRVTTPHVQSFVLISMLRGQPKTPPSGYDLAVLNYHLIETSAQEFKEDRETDETTTQRYIIGKACD